MCIYTHMHSYTSVYRLSMSNRIYKYTFHNLTLSIHELVFYIYV